MYLSVDVEDNEILAMIEDEVQRVVKLEAKTTADVEITRQFESIQKELEGCALRHVNERLVEIQAGIENEIEQTVMREILKVVRCLQVTLDAPVVRGDIYLESGEGTAGKERAARNG